MYFQPDNLACDTCGEPASVHLRDQQSGEEHLYCEEHAPSLWPGENSHLQIQRHRMPPGSACSQGLLADERSPEHQSFQEEMCDLRILGGEGASRYYLSKITDSDQFALWSDEFLSNIREFVVQTTDGAAACFTFDANTINFMTPILHEAYLDTNSNGDRKLTRQERAVVLLLHHPSWSDEQIADQVPTTVKQLQRNCSYTTLKSTLMQ